MYYTLNNKGEEAVRKFIETHGKDGLNKDAFFTDAEDQANGVNGNGFINNCDPSLELGRQYSKDGNPKILWLDKDMFDAAEEM